MAENQGQSKSAMEITGNKKETNSFSGKSESDGTQLEQFISFIKENWKPVLSELVAVGVTTYLNHETKSKASRAAKN